MQVKTSSVEELDTRLIKLIRGGFCVLTFAFTVLHVQP